jgi:hypothetical protein
MSSMQVEKSTAERDPPLILTSIIDDCMLNDVTENVRLRDLIHKVDEKLVDLFSK